MTLLSDLDGEGYRVPLDPDTADRLLAGAIAPEDAPPGYAGVARLLDAAAATGERVLEREAEVVALIAEAVRRSPGPDPSPPNPRRSFMPFALTRPRLSAATLVAALACSSGLATAGALPGAAQDVASSMLAKVGISVPGVNENAGIHPHVRGQAPETANPAQPDQASGKGGEISELATTTDLTGVEKGAAISTAASDGKSQAGQHGKAATAAPAATPNAGGTATADAASGGKSSKGTATANEKSGGKSAAGSGNASSGQETAAEASAGHSRRP